MTTLSSNVIALAALTGVVASLVGCASTDGRHETSVGKFPAYALPNQISEIRKPASFSVNEKFSHSPQNQWFFNGALIDSNSAPVLGVTDYDTPHLQITYVSPANCGFYIYRKYDSHKVSETAQLFVTERLSNRSELTPMAAIQTTTVVYGTPIAGKGGTTSTTCPGAYKGYVEYLNPGDPTGAGSWAFPHGGQAIDANGNWVVYYGAPYSNHGCGPTIPAVPNFPNYHIYIFFKNSVPSGPYPITLIVNP
jgi:hypothetical protein